MIQSGLSPVSFILAAVVIGIAMQMLMAFARAADHSIVKLWGRRGDRRFRVKYGPVLKSLTQTGERRRQSRRTLQGP